MATDANGAMSPDAAFGVLGNETRMEILQTLGETDDPLSFSELRERVGMDDSGQFNYHLDKLVGHFVRDTDDGYALAKAGERVIEAVLSGAVTESPRLEPTCIDQPCPLCGSPVEVSYRSEWVATSCTECAGVYGESGAAGDAVPAGGMERGYLGGQPLPPAGVKGRTAAEVLHAADTWSSLEMLGASSGICPRCSAPIDREIRVCEEHESGVELCEACDRRHAVQVDQSCTNCPFSGDGAAVIGLAADTDVLAFQTSHGLNPITPTPEFYRVMLEYEEDLVSTDPFEARFTWTVDGDSLTLTVVDDLDVVDVDRSSPE